MLMENYMAPEMEKLRMITDKTVKALHKQMENNMFNEIVRLYIVH